MLVESAMPVVFNYMSRFLNLGGIISFSFTVPARYCDTDNVI